MNMKWPHCIITLCALGLLAGCAAINRSERNTLLQHNVSPVVCDRMVRGEILTLSDIIELSQRQVPPRLVVRYLYSTRAIYSLDKQALARLNQAKVSREITDYLLETPALFAPRLYAGPYPYYDGGGWYPFGAYRPYSYYPYGPGFYGDSSVIIVGSRWHCR